MLNIVINVVLPVLILTQLSSDDRLGPDRALLLALAIPIAYAAWELIRVRKISWQPILGIVGVLMTGGFRLLELPPEWFAVKEAIVPAAFAVAILVSAWIGKPLARVFLNAFLDKDRIQAALRENGTEDEYEQRTAIATYLLAGAFTLSAILNFVLARMVVTADPGTDSFNDQLGRMTALSYPVITLPVMIVLVVTIFYILNTVGKLTGLEIDDMVKQDPKKQKKAAAEASTDTSRS
jgi:intracellular septation protein A